MMRLITFGKAYFLVAVLLFCIQERGQSQVAVDGRLVVQTGVPFLQVSPDARASGLGDGGVATSPDAYSQHWNVAKHPFAKERGGIALAYIPWLQGLGGGLRIHHSYLSGFYRHSDLQVFSASFRYFSLGEIQETTTMGLEANRTQPFELAIDLGYSMKLSQSHSLGVAFRYIRTDISTGERTQAGNAYAVDLGWFHSRTFGALPFTAAISISNVGSKVTYDQSGRSYFLPATLRVGSSLGYIWNTHHRLSGHIELSKLLVPITNKVGGTYLKDGKQIQTFGGSTSNITSIEALFSSFTDSPDGFSGELKEIIWSGGIEYAFQEMFFGRVGYFYENESLGGRRFLSFGTGLSLYKFLLDLSFVIAETNHPLNNTIKVSLSYKF